MGVAVSLASGCVQTHVAAVQADSASSDSGEDGFSADGDSGDATLSDDTRDGDGADSGVACELPSIPSDCDATAEPLRAFEVLCHAGISAATFQSSDANAWRRTHEFGNAFWIGQDSTAVLALSTGQLPEPSPSGQVALDPGAGANASTDNANPPAATLPDPVVSDVGSGDGTPFSACDGVGDCSATLAALVGAGPLEDLLWFRFDADVPPGVHGYRVRVAVLTAEYPEARQAAVSDAFVWWTSGEMFTGNLATLQGEPATVAGLADRFDAFSGDHPSLGRTGFDGRTGQPCTIAGEQVADCPVGAATGWMDLVGPASPGERISIVGALFDVGDAGTGDTVVLLDDWQWQCEPCAPGQDCGLQ